MEAWFKIEIIETFSSIGVFSIPTFPPPVF